MPDYDKRHIPPKVHRREITARVHRRRTCTPHGVYFPVTWTIPDEVIGEGDFGPLWVADRDYWVAGVAAAMDSNAGTADLEMNIRRITTGGSDGAVLVSDARLVIEVGEKTDSVTNGNDADWDSPDFNVLRLLRGEIIYPRILQFGTGDRMEITVNLVAVREFVP